MQIIIRIENFTIPFWGELEDEFFYILETKDELSYLPSEGWANMIRKVFELDRRFEGT